MKVDPYKHKEQFEKWINSIEGKSEISGLSKINPRFER